MTSSLSPIAISGIGLVTPLGINTQTTWEALLAGQFIRDHGRVSGALPEAKTRVGRLGLAAAREALANSTEIHRREMALVVGTSKGPIDDWLTAPSTLSDLEDGFGISQLAGELAARLRIGGPILTTCSACASGLHALIRGVLLIQNGDADRVMVVAAESSLHPMFLSSFEKLGVLAPIEIGCRPFDVNRAGFLVSEAAAAVVLERATADGPHPRINRVAMSADASHLTRTSESNEPLKRAIRTVIADQQIDLVHAHGTGTVQNDPAEIAAIRHALGGQLAAPNVYSHKGALGHTSGAAGLISVVINVMSHRNGVVPPNARLEQPISSAGLAIDSKRIQRPVRRSVAIAAGFGGHIAVVALAS